MSVSRWSVWCDRIVEVGWLIAVTVTPLFVNMYSRRGFEADKLALLRTIATLMTAAWLIGWLDRCRNRSSPDRFPAHSVVSWATLVFAAITILTSLTSIAPRVAWLGSYTRSQGAYTLLSFVAIVLCVLDRLRTRSQWNRLLNTLVLASVPVAVYALLQNADLDPLWGQRGASGRAASTLGNPIYLAAYLMMMFFIALGMAADSLHALRSRARFEAGRAVLYGVIALLQFTALMTANSRGPFLGWLAGLGLLSLLIAAMLRRCTLIVTAVAVGVIGVTVLIAANVPGSPLTGLRDALGLSRLLSLTANPGDSADVRTVIWQGSADIVAPHAPVQLADGAIDPLNGLRPIVGYGPESMYLVFQQFFPPELTTRGGYSGDTLVGRSHNETWDVLITGGLVGLTTYQLVFMAAWLSGLPALGLMSTRRDRRTFISLWLGGGAVGSATAIALDAPQYAGLGLPIGTLVGLVIYVVIYALRSIHAATPVSHQHRDRWLIAALLAALTAHYVETQFGIAVAATRLLFWLGLALIGVAGATRLTEDEAQPVTDRWIGRSAAQALLTVVLIATLLYAFVINYEHLNNPLEIVWRALTYDQAHGVGSMAALGLLILTWLAALITMWVVRINLPRRVRVHGSILFTALSLSLLAAWAVFFARQPGVDMVTATGTLHDEIAIANGQADLFSLYTITLIGLWLLAALAMMSELTDRLRWISRRWSMVAAVPLLIGVILLNSRINIEPIRADMIYRQGLGFEQQANSDYAATLYQHALTLTPNEDVYYRGLGVAYLQAEQFEAAQLAFERARQLNPLQADYAAGLGQVYRSWADQTTDPALRAERLAQADRLYAEALSLRPNDTALQAGHAAVQLTP